MHYRVCYQTLVLEVTCCSFCSCRERDRSNQQKYKKSLKTIKRRVESRPLLLEQASCKSVGEAKANYVAALRKVGFSEEEIETLLRDVAENSST